jgi:hypothetical protein
VQVPFGGWSTPAIKQFDWYATPCGLSIDSDWYPDGAAVANATTRANSAEVASSLRGANASPTELPANWWQEWHEQGYARSAAAAAAVKKQKSAL